jgi:hypothetical protein
VRAKWLGDNLLLRDDAIYEQRNPPPPSIDDE